MANRPRQSALVVMAKVLWRRCLSADYQHQWLNVIVQRRFDQPELFQRHLFRFCKNSLLFGGNRIYRYNPAPESPNLLPEVNLGIFRRTGILLTAFPTTNPGL